jgi:predicted CoA-binding protein
MMGIEKDILTGCHTVAIVGLSSNEARPSNHVGQYLKNAGYKIIPVNPSEKMVLGEICYPNLSAIPEKIDVVDIFRRSEDVMPIVEEAIKVEAKAVWMQEGIVNEAAAIKARAAGLKVVMNRCMLKEHVRLTGL